LTQGTRRPSSTPGKPACISRDCGGWVLTRCHGCLQELCAGTVSPSCGKSGAHAPRDAWGIGLDSPLFRRDLLSGSCEDPAPRRTLMRVLASTAQVDALATPRGMWSRAEPEKEGSQACRSPLEMLLRQRDGGTVDQRWQSRHPLDAPLAARAAHPPCPILHRAAESHLTSTLFRQILGRIERLAWHPTCSRRPDTQGERRERSWRE